MLNALTMQTHADADVIILRSFYLQSDKCLIFMNLLILHK